MELIKIDTYHFVVVDDSEIREGDWVLTKENTIHQVDYVDAYTKINEWKKITHSTQPLNTKFNDWFDAQIITLQEVKELIGEKSWKGYIDGTEWEVEFIDGELKLK
jgi:hypothetical protein